MSTKVDPNLLKDLKAICGAGIIIIQLVVEHYCCRIPGQVLNTIFSRTICANIIQWVLRQMVAEHLRHDLIIVNYEYCLFLH